MVRQREDVMRILKPASLVLFMIVALAACNCETPQQPADTAAPVEQAAATDAAPLPMVEVPAEGIELEPPVQVSQIPDGAWYCPMETVHYARMEQGDGTCPVCGMDLVQKVAAEPSAEGTAEPPAEGAATDTAADEGAGEAAPSE
jgi:hypothetical protein